MEDIKRVYHSYELWEEIKHNMWGDVGNVKACLDVAIKFTGNHSIYGYWMNKVTEDWKYSCENALTDPYISQKAWIGHAAVAYALNIPEDITRRAWGFLTDEQQFLANEEARRAICIWKNTYRKNKQLCPNMGGQMLFKWDT